MNAGGSTNEILHAMTTHQIGIGLIEAPAFRPDLKIETFAEDELILIVRPIMAGQRSRA